MRRRSALGCIALGLCACLRVPQKLLIPVPPETVGKWVRRGLETPDLGDAPEPMHTLRPEAWVRARYTRAADSVVADAFGFRSPAGALESAQKWRSEEGAIASLHGQIFFVCSSSGLDTDELRRTARMLEAAWLGSAR